MEIELAPGGNVKSAETDLWVRRPEWATGVKIATRSGAKLPVSEQDGYLRIRRKFGAGDPVLVRFEPGLWVERRRFQTVSLPRRGITRLRDVTLLDGPEVLFAAPAPASGRMTLLARMDANGRVGLWPSAQGGYVTAALADLNAGEKQIVAALETAKPVALRPESELRTSRRAVFAHDLVVAPAELLPESLVAKFCARASQTEQALAGPFFGKHLEQTPDMWIGAGGWAFGSNGLHVTSGDVGLLEGSGYTNYVFEFDLEMPKSGEGMAGFVVRANDAGNCVMFQLQSSDSPFNAPQWKTRPNTLRPHVRRDGEWRMSDPVDLPKPVRRSERHRIGVECRGSQIIVRLDGERIFTGDDGGLHWGTVGFRAVGPAEQGVFSNISLDKL